MPMNRWKSSKSIEENLADWLGVGPAQTLKEALEKPAESQFQFFQALLE